MKLQTAGLPELSHAPIDIHSHFNHGSRFEIPSGKTHLREVADLMREYDRLGIGQVGMSSFASVYVGPVVEAAFATEQEQLECICRENEFTHQLAREWDRIYQWVVVDPRQKKTYEQAEKMLSSPKTLGLKIHPSYHGYDILEYGDSVFSFAQNLGAVVLMHPQHLDEIAPLADKYPKMKLILAHLGSMGHVNAIAKSRAGNLYTDTSGRNICSNRILEYAVEQVGSDRILFGTDTYSLPLQYGRIALADLPQTDKENVLYKNALSLFPHALK